MHVRKEKSAVEGDLKKSLSGVRVDEGVEPIEAGLEVGLMGIHREERDSHLLGLRGSH